MPDRRLDPVARHVGGGQQHEGREREQRGQVPREDWRIPQRDGRGAGRAVAPDDQRLSGNRHHRVNDLPGRLAEPSDLRAAPVVG
jgi:hypothetical protein